MYGLYYTFCADDLIKREGDAVCRQLGHAGADKVANNSLVDLNLVYPPIGFQQLKCPEGAKSTGECTSIFQPYDGGDGCMSGRASVTCGGDGGGGDSGSVGVGKRVQGLFIMFLVNTLT
ncbi:hypothetical protein SNE40_010661 [Patella caerulea]|uniref:SRCR domain-containing protein n=1 Tax=Patella caerulea TaxID=87958 RepID=A0AAN8JWG1_PATCE